MIYFSNPRKVIFEKIMDQFEKSANRLKRQMHVQSTRSTSFLWLVVKPLFGATGLILCEDRVRVCK